MRWLLSLAIKAKKPIWTHKKLEEAHTNNHYISTYREVHIWSHYDIVIVVSSIYPSSSFAFAASDSHLNPPGFLSFCSQWYIIPTSQYFLPCLQQSCRCVLRFVRAYAYTYTILKYILYWKYMNWRRTSNQQNISYNWSHINWWILQYEQTV